MADALATTIVFRGDGDEVHRIPVTYKRFPDGDIHCEVPELDRLSGKSLTVLHSLYPYQNRQLMRLTLLLDLLRAVEPSSLEVFIPYLPYSRQDKRHHPGEALGSETVCRLLTYFGCQKLITIDCHFIKQAGLTKYGDLVIQNFTATPFLLDAVTSHLGHSDYDVISPDEGASYMAKVAGGQHMYKRRHDNHVSSSSAYRSIKKIDGGHIHLSSKVIVILDDMISTGSTIINAIKELQKYAPKNIVVATTHGFFLNDCLTAIQKLTDGCIYTDTISQPDALEVTERIFNDYYESVGA